MQYLCKVYCGPIKTVFSYRMDATISGGSNIMVEIIRQTLIDLAKLCKVKKVLMPKRIGFQFDNCGEVR